MLLEGKFALKVPIQKVWDTLLAPNTLLSCAPGTEKIERLDEKTYDCVVKQKVGSISVKFKFKSVLTKVGASIVGKLAMFGDRIMRARAKKLQAELTSVLDGKSISLV